MSTEQLNSAARNWIENGWSARNPDEFGNYFSPELVNHGLPPDTPPGLEGTKMFASLFLSAFQDLHVHIDDLLAGGDRTVLRWSMHGTHQGELMGVPLTGKRVTITGIAKDRFEDGKSVAHWEIADQMGLMQQLGVIPEG